MPYSLEKWMAGRWIAGPGMEDALEKARQINRGGISVIVNYLGEELTRKLDVEEAVETYLRLITDISKDRIHGDVSVKPTQIGLSIGQELMRSNYMRIMEHAKMCGIFVWLDMEGPDMVSRAIDVYLDVGRHVRGGICVQAYLKRSLDDARAITRKNGIVRLVKGAYTYREGGGMIRRRDEVGWNYFEIMRYLFEHSGSFTIATHDRTIVDGALELNRKRRRDVTYAMLNGIDNQYAKRLASSGEKTALYLPFGSRWVGYSYRRLREMGHIRLILSSLFRSQQL